jgi:hypothetical protein
MAYQLDIPNRENKDLNIQNTNQNISLLLLLFNSKAGFSVKLFSPFPFASLCGLQSYWLDCLIFIIYIQISFSRSFDSSSSNIR